METTTWCIIHHTECGMHALSEEIITDLLKDDLESAVLEDGIWKNPEKVDKNKNPGSNYAEHIHWYVRRSEKDPNFRY